jgi:glycerol-3-phosphate cytidylyltransferase
MAAKTRIVLTYGTYDLLHPGHIHLLRRAKALGDFLIVGLSSDRFNAVKGKDAYYPYAQRKVVVEALRDVDLVIPENDWDQKVRDVQEYAVDVFVMGADWEGKFDFLREWCEVVYLPRTEGISTTQIKNDFATGG